MYQVDVLIQGFPGRAICHGGLGWSTVTLLRGNGRTILVDVGAFGVRRHLQHQLEAHGVKAADITDVVLTHAHYDHAVNYILFPRAKVWIGADELRWAAAQPPGFNPLPELYVRALDTGEHVHRVQADTEFLPGLRAIAAPGHTPGHLLFYLSANDIPVLFTGDAAKNRAELLSGRVDASESHADSERSLQTIWHWWREVPGTILIPGHDLSMRLDNHGQPEYIGKRAAAIAAWFSESLSQVTHLDLTGAQSHAG